MHSRERRWAKNFKSKLTGKSAELALEGGVKCWVQPCYVDDRMAVQYLVHYWLSPAEPSWNYWLGCCCLTLPPGPPDLLLPYGVKSDIHNT